MGDGSFGLRTIEELGVEADRVEREAIQSDLTRRATRDGIGLQTPQEQTNMGNVIAPPANRNTTYIKRMRCPIESAIGVRDAFAGIVVAHLEPAATRRVHAGMIHILRPA